MEKPGNIMEKISQKELVRRKLERDGEVTLGWALAQRPNITRLASYICQLRRYGMSIEMERNTEKVGSNTLYRLAKRTLF